MDTLWLFTSKKKKTTRDHVLVMCTMDFDTVLLQRMCMYVFVGVVCLHVEKVFGK